MSKRLFKCSGNYYIEDTLTGCHLWVPRDEALELIETKGWEVKIVGKVPFNAYYSSGPTITMTDCKVYRPRGKESREFFVLPSKYESGKKLLSYDSKKDSWDFYTWNQVEEFDYTLTRLNKLGN